MLPPLVDNRLMHASCRCCLRPRWAWACLPRACHLKVLYQGCRVFLPLVAIPELPDLVRFRASAALHIYDSPSASPQPYIECPENYVQPTHCCSLPRHGSAASRDDASASRRIPYSATAVPSP